MSDLTVEQELEKVREALRKANAEAKQFREQAEGLQSQVETNQDWKTKALRAEARAALKDQGIKNPDRVLKLVDLEGVDINEEGKLTGLDDKVKTVKGDFPELFDVKREVAGGADIFTKGEGPKPMTGTEAQVKRLFAN